MPMADFDFGWCLEDVIANIMVSPAPIIRIAGAAKPYRRASRSICTAHSGACGSGFVEFVKTRFGSDHRRESIYADFVVQYAIHDEFESRSSSRLLSSVSSYLSMLSCSIGPSYPHVVYRLTERVDPM